MTKERKILGAEVRGKLLPKQRITELIELNETIYTMRGGRLEKLVAAEAVGQPELDLGKMLALFNKHGVECVVVGGYAVAFHGHVRATSDFCRKELLGFNRTHPVDPLRILNRKEKRAGRRIDSVAPGMLNRWTHAERDGGDRPRQSAALFSSFQ